MAKPTFTQEEQAEICRMYQENPKWSAREIGTLMGIANPKNASETIRRILTNNGLVIRSTRGYLVDPVNESYFQAVDSADKAYWLGYFAADGCIAKSAGSRRTMRFYLAAKDEWAVRQFASDLQYGGTIYYNYQKNQYGFQFNSQQMANDLIKLGVLDWKQAVNYQLLDNIPNHLFNMFVRGFFDGDGCFTAHYSGAKTTKQIEGVFCASKCSVPLLLELGTRIKSRLTSLSDPVIRQRSNCSKVGWNGNQQIETFGDWLYAGGGHKLNRKYARYLSIKSRDFIHYFKDINDWELKYEDSDEISSDELNGLIVRYVEVIRHGFVPLRYHKSILSKKLSKELKRLKRYDWKSQVDKDGNIQPKSAYNYGNDLIFHFQPQIWNISQNGNRTFMQLSRCEGACKRAVKELLTNDPRSNEPRKITPVRLIRELSRTGISKASLLNTPLIITILQKLDLKGKWFDPCAGWGSRLLAAYVLGLEYETTDPAAHQYGGLLRLQACLRTNYKIWNKKFQDLDFPQSDFVFTSPPFYDKEDYQLGDIWATFENWYLDFLKPLVDKCKASSKRVTLHIDDPMCSRLEQDYSMSKTLILMGSRLHSRNEWVVEIGDSK